MVEHTFEDGTCSIRLYEYDGAHKILQKKTYSRRELVVFDSSPKAEKSPVSICFHDGSGLALRSAVCAVLPILLAFFLLWRIRIFRRLA